MKHRPLVLSLLLLSSPAAAGPVPAALKAKLTAEPTIEAATSSANIEGIADIDGLHARFLVPCAPQDAMALLWDIDRFQKVFPDIQRLVVKKRKPRLLDVEFGIDVKLAWVTYTLRRVRNDQKGEIHWKELSGDLNHVRGHWTIKPTAHPEVTELVYSSFVEVSSLVPTSMIRDGALSKVKTMPDRVRPACAEEMRSRKQRQRQPPASESRQNPAPGSTANP